ncbi:MAG: hypothetical protein OEY52_17140 [Gammaproteobacteria bacterium]|nr:hypothetical protein [Gammaproteobacteria bacterium]
MLKFTLTVFLSAFSLVALADKDHEHGHKGIVSAKDQAIQPAFDIVHARVKVDGPNLVFQQRVTGKAGSIKPTATGQLAGSEVFSYVWPTSMDSSAVGFEPSQGILALVLTAHPDFDDTPRYDENRDGDKTNDGNVWHSHWVVLTHDDACGPGALKVKDIPKGSKPKLPSTWPDLPLFIDSPGYEPQLKSHKVSIKVPLKDVGFTEDFRFDSVTAGLRINQSVHNPLLCVVKVHDVASSDLSLPGKVYPYIHK